jgi:hypothetical protein
MPWRSDHTPGRARCRIRLTFLRGFIVNPKRPKVEQILNPTLFPMEKLEEVAEPADQLKTARILCLELDSSWDFRASIHRRHESIEFPMFLNFAQEYYTWTGRIHALIESRVSCEGDSL